MIELIHKKIKIKDDYRMIVISDIHGHLDRFKALLKKVNYNSEEDYLVILGDFVEKGDQSLETLHYIQKLDENKKVFVLAGNCEWALTAMLELEEFAKEIPTYFRRVSTGGMVREVYHRLDLEHSNDTWLGKQKRIREYLKEELDYMSHLPLTLKVNEELLFVHAGIDQVAYQHCKLSTLLEMQDFYKKGHNLDLDVIVGHIPTSNFRETIDNRILFNKEEKIICLDGGTGVKPVSQLNALIINKKDQKLHYSSSLVRNYPKCHVTSNEVLKLDEETCKIAYPDYEIEVLEKGEAFSKCRLLHNHKTISIKNEFIVENSKHTYCLDDYTNYTHHPEINDTVEVIGIYGDDMYCIINHQVGWIKVSSTDYDVR